MPRCSALRVFRREAVLLLLVAFGQLAGCATPPRCRGGRAGADTVYVVSRGWHVEIGIPAERLTGSLRVFRDIFPGARAIMFGYGKRTFMTAPADDISEYLLGPVPGPAVIEAVGLRDLPPAAYGASDMVTLALTSSGDARLDAFIWNDLRLDRTGEPLLVGPGEFPGSLFYAARSRYDLLHTCNTWAAAALAAAGLPISAEGVIFSGQVMARATSASCR